MLASTPLLLALVASVHAAPVVQQKQVAVQLSPTEKLVLLFGACMTAPADVSKTLNAGKKSVSAEVPNTTAVPSFGDDGSPPDTCTGYVVDISVPSSSDPPSGYTDKLDISVTVNGQYVPQTSCNNDIGKASIYKVKSDGTKTWKGGGSFVATWNTTADPDTCDMALASDFASVSGSVPDSGTAKWRIIVASGGNVTVKASRRKS
jgi:hypothetical protein